MIIIHETLYESYSGVSPILSWSGAPFQLTSGEVFHSPLRQRAFTGDKRKRALSSPVRKRSFTGDNR